MIIICIKNVIRIRRISSKYSKGESEFKECNQIIKDITYV